MGGFRPKEQAAMEKANPKIDLSFLAEKWPSTIVSRTQISRFTGGLICPRRMANLDCLGQGPEGALRIGRHVAYPVKSLISWLESRSVFVKDRP
jgi:hypothetical protein